MEAQPLGKGAEGGEDPSPSLTQCQGQSLETSPEDLAPPLK